MLSVSRPTGVLVLNCWVTETDERTLVGTIILRHASDYTIRLVYGGHVKGALSGCLLASLNSWCFDYVTRQCLAGANLSDYV